MRCAKNAHSCPLISHRNNGLIQIRFLHALLRVFCRCACSSIRLWAQRLAPGDRSLFQSVSSATTSVPWSYRGLGSMTLLDTCSLNSLPPVRPLQGRPHPSHPWKKACPPSFRKELPPAQQQHQSTGALTEYMLSLIHI